MPFLFLGTNEHTQRLHFTTTPKINEVLYSIGNSTKNVGSRLNKIKLMEDLSISFFLIFSKIKTC